MPYIYSTLAQSSDYTFYFPVEDINAAKGKPRRVQRTITVKGGAGVIEEFNRVANFAVTKVEDEELAQLEEHPVFKMHKANGYITIATRSNQKDPFKETMEDLKAKDDCAQLDERELEKGSSRTANADTSAKPSRGKKM